MKKVFIPLLLVAVVFVAGFAGLVVAAFTTATTEFAGHAQLKLSFEDSNRNVVNVTVHDDKGAVVPADTQHKVLLVTDFETRETNVFDKLLGGPRPRNTNAVFYDDSGKRHEIRFAYDRHGQIWQSEISFPDNLITELRLESSTLDFRGMVGARREYHSVISAVASVVETGPASQ